MEPTIFREGTDLAGGRYVLERRLGTGGMATVWLAKDTRLARRVAIKVPAEALTHDHTFALRFEREAQTAAGLSHPNLVAVHDYGQEGERPYLVSEYVDGLTLAQIVDGERGPETEDLARTLLEALAHIHRAGIVHRDVKPGNVLVDREGKIQLTDFGIAQSTEETSLTATGHVIGTESYLAPELMSGRRAGPQSDLYSLGVLLSERLQHDDPDRVRRLIEALTQREPESRPLSAEDALDLLERRPVVVEPTTSTEIERPSVVERVRSEGSRTFPLPPGPPEPIAPPAGATGARSRVLAACIGLLLVAAVATGAILIASSGGDGDGGGAKGRKAAEAQPSTTETSTVTEQATTTVPAEPTTTTAEPPEPKTGGVDSARGIELNNEGYALLQQGDVEAALPKLQEAVASFPEDSTEIDYAYALFNYAQALRLSGDPAAAIPLLEKRLSFSDFKVEEVNAELKLAKEAAKG